MKAASDPLTIRLDPPPGRSAGWQLFDRATSNIIAEGPWCDAVCETAVPVPPEPGDYRLLVSPVSEELGWAYQRGESIRVIDIHVSKTGWELAADRRTSLSRLRFENLPARIRQFLVEPWQLMWANRSLIRTMVKRDVESRYKGTFAGVSWTIAQPLLLMLTYWFVFGFVLKARLGGDDRPSIFVVYFLCGMLPWLAISEALGRAPNAILESRNLVKKLVFPVSVLPVAHVASGLVTQGLATVVFLFLHRAILAQYPVDALWIPIYLIPQILLTLGLCWAWAAIGVFAKDLAQINGFLLTLWFFLTPICYPEDSLPAGAVTILRKNPLFKLVGGYRLLFIAKDGPNWVVAFQLALIGLACFYGGFAIFRKLRRNFADAL